MKNSFMETIILVVAFVILWKSGLLDSSFELILLLGTILCGVAFAADKLYFKKIRDKKVNDYLSQFPEKLDGLNNDVQKEVKEKVEELKELPRWLDWTAGLFPILFVIFLVRSFVVEPFQIPSGSMMPTMIEGDKILVNKSSYGLRLPVLDTKITDGEPVKRGDIVVFHYPLQHNVNYIKRVAGLPGDTIVYKDKEIFINGEKMPQSLIGNYDYPKQIKGPNYQVVEFEEKLGDKTHRILKEPISGTVNNVMSKDFLEHCKYDIEYIECKVPEGHYYMIGDNRDGSADSRYWGFVPDKNLVGKAFYIWANFDDMSRVGSVE